MKTEDEGSSNSSMNREIGDVIATRFSRRSMLSGGLGAAALVTVGGAGMGSLAGCAPEIVPPDATPLLGFD